MNRVLSSSGHSNGFSNTLTKEEVRELKEIFQLVDTDGGGTISKSELASLLVKMRIQATKAEIESISNEIDIKQTGEIDFESFLHAMSRKVSTSVTPERIKWAFSKFHRPQNADGTVTVRDLIRALTEFGDPAKRMSNEEAASMIRVIAPELRMDDLFDYDNYIDVLFAP